MHLVLGMSYYNQQNFVAAIDQLAKAEEYRETQKMAQQWQQFVNTEKLTTEALEAEIESD